MRGDLDKPGRIRCGTIAAPAFDVMLADDAGLIGLSVIELGTVPADRAAAVAFHRDALRFEVGDTWSIPCSVINASFGLPDYTITDMTMTQAGRIPACEIDQHHAAATPCARHERVPPHREVADQKNAWMPVCARPRISAWTSCVPS
jgi:hypothetical protein